MPRRPFRRLAFVALLGGAVLPQVGCASAAAKRQETMQPETTVRVFNEDFLDATVYLVQRGQRFRLGVATSHATAIFVIPPRMLFGPTALSFQLAPIGGRRRPQTEEIVVSAGDEIELHAGATQTTLVRSTP